MEFSTADFIQFSGLTVEIYPLGGRQGTHHHFQAFQRFVTNTNNVYKYFVQHCNKFIK